jgi:DNA polymerase-3 subunit epsilon
MKAWIDKNNVEISFDEIKWIDTLSDIDYPPHCGSRKLTYLAADHGFINPFAHRAVFDVLTMMRVLDQYPITEIIETMNQPTYIIQAVVSFQDKELARERFFRWNGVKRMWLRSMKKNKWEAEEFPFDTNVIDEGK